MKPARLPSTQTIASAAATLWCAASAMLALTGCDAQVDEYDIEIPLESHVEGSVAELLARRAEIDAMVQPYLESRVLGGVVIGLLNRDGHVAFSYGRRSVDNEQAPDSHTVFEIASITKTFNGLLLAREVHLGHMLLEDPLADHLEPGFPVPNRKPPWISRPVQMLDLATHTSGLQRDYPWEKGDGYYMLAKYLDTIFLNHPAGKEYEYSNLGAGLQGLAIEYTAHDTLPHLVRDHITEPLGMVDTGFSFRPDQEAQRRVARGWSAGFHTYEDFDAYLVGAGMMRSTAEDLMTYLDAHMNLAPVSEDLGEAIKLVTPKRFSRGGSSAVGINWHIEYPKSGAIHWHSGVTSQFSFVGMLRGSALGVVVLSIPADGASDEDGNLDREQAAGAAIGIGFDALELLRANASVGQPKEEAAADGQEQIVPQVGSGPQKPYRPVLDKPGYL